MSGRVRNQLPPPTLLEIVQREYLRDLITRDEYIERSEDLIGSGWDDAVLDPPAD